MKNKIVIALMLCMSVPVVAQQKEGSKQATVTLQDCIARGLENNFSIATGFESYIPRATQTGDMFASAGARLTVIYTTEGGETQSLTLDKPIVK